MKCPLCGQFNSPVGADPPDLVFGYPFYRLGRWDKDGGDENDSGDDHGLVMVVMVAVMFMVMVVDNWLLVLERVTRP